MDAPDTLLRLGLALLIGLLVGLQRERSSPRRIAGIRTFALVSLFGGACGALADRAGAWTLGAGLVCVAALTIMGSLVRERARERATEQPPEREPGARGYGVTTEVALLVMFVTGALLALAPIAVGVCIGGATAVLLHLKAQLHGFVRRLNDREFHAIMQFALVSAVILPVLPDAAYDKYGALNPRHIWLMVTLITGMSLAGYLVHKLIGETRGALAAGAIGGLISSTATTVSFGRQGRREGLAPLAAAVIGLASTIMYARVLLEIGAVAPGAFPGAIAPLGVMAAATVGGALLVWIGARKARGRAAGAEHGNPAELKAALLFGATYAVIALVTAVARERLGAGALYAVAAVSGATEMDAITLSIARMAGSGEIDPSGAWRYIVVGAMSNTVFKWGVALALGGRRLALLLAPAFGGAIVAGALWLALAPAVGAPG